ncbi:hypothetical protein [Streptosporangium lutulentum]|uniref:Lipoprotein n=1 Tax=Streptosporangium lutulentum TaxID=1461250 RepID=A0ABT9Q3I5_9ACTN|nr:hypothetical protein [Streptosporangium lutulentum]MDP9841289.1 hypothetical protein [Streptosporangium lutulentum]
MKITRSLATAAATLAIAGGIIASTGGAASAATAATTATTATASQTVAVSVSGHGERYRFDGHRFYRWFNGGWRAVSFDYARSHHYDRNHRDRDYDRGHNRRDHNRGDRH